MHATITFLIRYKATAMALACTAAIGVPLATLAYTPGRPLALQTLFSILCPSCSQNIDCPNDEVALISRLLHADAVRLRDLVLQIGSRGRVGLPRMGALGGVGPEPCTHAARSDRAVSAVTA